MTKVMRAVDFCAGAGGWACAARGLPIQIVAAVDLWEPACRTYELNHPETEVIQADLRDPALQEDLVKRFAGVDLMLGGIPCEWLSQYRVMQPVEADELREQRATLDAVLGLVKRMDPHWWCLEDVVQLERELPPFTPHHRVEASRYSAQRRKRVFVGNYPPPLPGACTDVLRDRLRPGPYRIGRRAFGRTPQRSRAFTNTTTLGAWPDRKAPTVLCISSRRDAEMVVVDDSLPGGMRQMEWQEASSLQGFPDSYLFYGSPEEVATQIGRAIQIDTGRAILTAIVAQWQKKPAAAPKPRRAVARR